MILPSLRRGIPGRGDRDPAHSVAGTEGQRLCRTVHPNGPHRVPRSGVPPRRTPSPLGVGDIRQALQPRATPSRARPCCAGGSQRRLAAHHRRLDRTPGSLGWIDSRVLPKSGVGRCGRGTRQPRSSHRRPSKWGPVAPREDRFARSAPESLVARHRNDPRQGSGPSILRWHPTGRAGLGVRCREPGEADQQRRSVERQGGRRRPSRLTVHESRRTINLA